MLSRSPAISPTTSFTMAPFRKCCALSDPHSNFYDPKAYAKMQEDESGKYYGVGMVIQPQNNKIVVVYPFEGSPSFKAGLRPGDVIVSVDGKPTNNLDTTAVADMLKGPKGTHVHLTVSREGAWQSLNLRSGTAKLPPLHRPEIPDQARHWLHPHHAIPANDGPRIFDAIDQFGDLKGLILDLRGNPGRRACRGGQRV